jgi:hypothetical protein
MKSGAALREYYAALRSKEPGDITRWVNLFFSLSFFSFFIHLRWVNLKKIVLSEKSTEQHKLYNMTAFQKIIYITYNFIIT